MFLFFMKTCSIEWAAGLFEGEGCISLSQRKGRSRASASLILDSTDEDVVVKFGQIVGVKCSRYHSPKKPHWKPQWRWDTGKRSEVARILSLLLPYFGNRRAYKALNVLDHLELS